MMVKESLGDLKRLQINGLEIANATQEQSCRSQTHPQSAIPSNSKCLPDKTLM